MDQSDLNGDEVQFFGVRARLGSGKFQVFNEGYNDFFDAEDQSPIAGDFNNLVFRDEGLPSPDHVTVSPMAAARLFCEGVIRRHDVENALTETPGSILLFSIKVETDVYIDVEVIETQEEPLVAVEAVTT